MHIHGNQLNLNTINPYSEAAEKALAAQRAAEVRKKLLKDASDIEGISSPEESTLLGLWMASGHGQAQGDPDYYTADSGSD
jgi:hypothetical protein